MNQIDYNKSRTVKVVGRGAYGVVYLCVDKMGSNFISKHIPVSDMSPSERQSAMNEVEVLSVLSHPNVIGYYSSHVENKALIISMEYASGGTLAEYLQRQSKHLAEDEVLHKFTQISLGLEYIHSKKILHRDLKTQNILLCANHKITKIGDFGISKVLVSKSKANTVVGSPSYLSPELCSGKPYNQMSDVWALGCVLYEIMALKRAFDAPSLPQLIQLIVHGKFEPLPAKVYSSQLLFLVKCLLHVDPEKRPNPSDLLQKPMLIKQTIKIHMEIGALPYTGIFENDTTLTASPRTVLKYCSLVTDGMSTLPQTKGTHVVSVGLGLYSMYHVTSDGRLMQWTRSRDVPESGEESRQSRDNAVTTQDYEEYCCVPVDTDTNVISVSAGEDFVLFVNDCKVLYSYGSGILGCLGHSNTTTYSEPKVVQSLFGWEVTGVSCGYQHVLVLTAENELYSWGLGYDGRLGHSNKDNTTSPQKVALCNEIVVRYIQAGPDCSALVSTDNELYCTGKNMNNKLLLGSQDISLCFTRAELPENLSVDKIVFSHCHMAMLCQGLLYTVGCNDELQLGRDDADPLVLREVLTDTEELLYDIAVTANSTIAVTNHNRVLQWGNNTLTPRLFTAFDNDVVVSSVCAAGEQFIVVGDLTC